MQTQAIATEAQPLETLSKSFAAIVRDAPANAKATIQADGAVLLGNQRLNGWHATAVAALVKNGIGVDGKLLRLMLASEVYGTIDVAPDGTLSAFGHVGATLTRQALIGLVQSAMQLNHETAGEKAGTAIIVAAKSGRIIGLRADGTRLPVDRLLEPLVEVGGFYPYYEVAGSDAGFMVPLPFAEERRNEAGAKQAFGKPVPMPYLVQAIERAQYLDYLNQMGSEVFEEDVGLAALKMGGKLSMGGY